MRYALLHLDRYLPDSPHKRCTASVCRVPFICLERGWILRRDEGLDFMKFSVYLLI